MPEQPWMDWMDGRCQDKKEKASLHRRQQQKMNIFFFFIKARSIDKWFDSCEILLLWFLLKRSIENEIRERQLVYFKCFDSSCSSSSRKYSSNLKIQLEFVPFRKYTLNTKLSSVRIPIPCVFRHSENRGKAPALWIKSESLKKMHKQTNFWWKIWDRSHPGRC